MACIPVLVMIYQLNNYYSYKYYYEQREWKNSHDIEKIENSIADKRKSIEQEKVNNQEMVKLLEVWKKRVEKIS